MKPSKKSKSHSEMLICNIPLVYIFLLSDVNPAEFFMKSDLYVDLGFFYIKVEHRWRALTVCIWLNVSFYWPPCYRAGLRCMCMCNVRKHMECVTQTDRIRPYSSSIWTVILLIQFGHSMHQFPHPVPRPISNSIWRFFDSELYEDERIGEAWNPTMGHTPYSFLQLSWTNHVVLVFVSIH